MLVVALSSDRYALLCLSIALSCSSTVLANDSVTLLGGVTSAASRATDQAKRMESQTAKLVYGRKELERYREDTVGAFLRKLPNMSFSGPPGILEDIRMNGMDKGYTQILINGAPVMGGGKERQINVNRFPTSLVERIEIMRTPSADMPNEGIGGTINIVLKEIQSEPVRNLMLGVGQSRHGDIPATLSGEYGDTKGNFSYLLSGAYNKRSQDKTKDKSIEEFDTAGQRKKWELEDETEKRTVTEIDFAPRFNWQLTDQDTFTLTPFLSDYVEEKDKPIIKSKYNTAATGSDLIANGSKFEDEEKKRETRRLEANWAHKLHTGGEFDVTARLEKGGEFVEKTVTEFKADGALSKTTLEDTDKTEKGWSTKARLQQPINGQHNLIGTLEYLDRERKDSKQTLENGTPKALGRGDNYQITEKVLNISLQDEWRLNQQHSLTPGVRLEHRKRHAAGAGTSVYDTKQNMASPSLHYKWAIDSQTNLRASTAKSAKHPKFDDISPMTELKAGTSTDPDKSGNPDLKPEYANNFDIGLERSFHEGNSLIGLNYSHLKLKDVVERKSSLESARYVDRPYNIGDGTSDTISLDFNSKLAWASLPQTSVRGNYSHFDSKINVVKTGETRRLKDQPKYIANVGFDHEIRSHGIKFGSNISYLPTLRKLNDDTGLPETESAQRLLDLYAEKKLSKNFTLKATVANVLDAKKVKYKPTYDSAGALTKLETEIEKTGIQPFITLEGTW